MTVKIFSKDGTSQDERLLHALQEGYFNVDEMRFEDLLFFAAEYSGLLKYFDLDYKASGNWQSFAASDEIFVLAAIIATDTNQLEADFFRFVRKREDASGGDEGESYPALDIARRIDSWHRQLGKLSSVAAAQLRDKITDVIDSTLRDELLQLRRFLAHSGVNRYESVFQELGSVWQGEDEIWAERGEHIPFLKSNFYAFLNAVSYLQESAQEILSVSLGRSNHDPAIGLYVAFLKLFTKIQGRLNQFTHRHLDFYYEKVLKIARRDFIPDSTHLVFCPDMDGREVLIRSGTEFKAGLDENGVDLIYSANNDLFVNDAKVAALHTLYFRRNRLSSPENALSAPPDKDGNQRSYTTSAKLNRLCNSDGSRLWGKEGAMAFPLFGDPRRSKDMSVFDEARIGFAVASNVLLMRQGKRDIVLTVKLESDGEEDRLQHFTHSLAEIMNTTAQDAFFKAFRNMFRISLTGETGWIEIEEYLPLCDVVDDRCEANSLKIAISLPDSSEAVIAYSKGIHGDEFETDLPVAKLAVNPDAYLYPYSLLSELAISEVSIEVEVRGCTDLLIYNQLGQLSINAQFNPFGPLPSMGDYWIIGSYEVARKKLAAFEMDIEWGSLPQQMGGFEEYYRAYPQPFDNSSFKVRLTALRDRKWIPSDESEQPLACLFETENAAANSEKVAKRRCLSLKGLSRYLRPIENISEEQFGYDTLAKDGFFKITLSSPDCAFGHKDYPHILSDVMTENARRKRFGPARLFLKDAPASPLPNPAYTPLVNSISVNYKAVAHISLAQVASVEEKQHKEKIFHLHPLGLESLSPKSLGKVYLVPRYEADGNLFIGISATRLSGLLTLFFHLREDSLPQAGDRFFNFTWHYLSSNRWKRLEKSQVVSDTTHGFLSSGIVTLAIPHDVEKGNTVMPGDLFWLRVTVDDNRMHALCSVYGVYTQALKVTWKHQDGSSLSHLEQKLPAGTIKEPKFSITGIREITQFMDSSGGLPPESDRQRTIRVSERLKHKNRAITPWDYERLILQQFPEIYKAKCFPCMTGDPQDKGRARPGHLLIAVIPYLKEPASVNMQPMVNALLLREVREFVEGISSMFTSIHVRNPVYEQIQVRCKVRLRHGVDRLFHHHELNQEIVDYLSPWNPAGRGARFGWRIRGNEIQSHIQELDYVESLSGLSMLHIREEESRFFSLSDTARVDAKNEIRPGHPWSIAIPVKRHLIEIIDDMKAWPSEKTGIGKLSIGSTFILSRGNQ